MAHPKLATTQSGYGVIYGLHAGDGVIRYIGQTIHFDRRMASHASSARLGRDLPVYRWIRKHGWSSIEVVILHEVDAGSLNDLEMVEIAKHDRRVLLNANEGGKGQRGFKHKPETREAASRRTRGQWTGERNPNYGKPLGEVAKAKMRAKKIGVRWSDERRSVQTVHRGEANGRAKLTAEKVLEIRRLHSRGATTVALAKMFDIAQSHAHRVAHNQVWRHV